jgi:hypothetical protein
VPKFSWRFRHSIWPTNPRLIAGLGARLLPRGKETLNIEEIIHALEAEKHCLNQAIALLREGRLNLQVVNDAIFSSPPGSGSQEDNENDGQNSSVGPV